MPPITPARSGMIALRQFLERRLPRGLELARSVRKARAFNYRYHRRADSLGGVQSAYTKGEAAPDAQLVQRLMASYRARSAETPTDQWLEIFNERHGDIHSAVSAGDVESTTAFLRNPASCDLFYGFDSLAKTLRKGGQRIEDKYAPQATLDALTCLAEAIGARRLEYPENYTWRAVPLDVGEVLAQIESVLGFKVPVPNPFPAEFGLATPNGVISYRVPQALYQGWRIRQLVDNVANPRVLEIGGGLGRTAYYARKFGIYDYSIVDIPVSSLAQGYFLGRTLGDESIWLHGEATPTDLAQRVKLLAPRDFLAGASRYDLIVNVDSLTEIGRESATEYWRAIQRQSNQLLSINHEVNDTTIADLVADAEPRVRSVRMPYWMRRGYVEELFRF